MTEEEDGRKVENRAVFCWTRNRNNNSEDMALFSEKLAIFKQIFEKYVTYFSKQEFLGKYEIRRVIFRVEICHDRRSCKICAGCVNFPWMQRYFSHNFAYNYMLYTQQVWFCTETVEILHTQLNSNKKATRITDINAFTLFLFEWK